ncbi:MAG TPA: hypothetical protein VGO85_03920 [Caldimonas sp.]|jgi:hypothetical protein|nr:hypothetical protein [Caldimonas sp.]
MNPTVVAAFKDRVAADAAVAFLRGSGPATRSIRADTAPDVLNSAAIEVDELSTGGFFGNAARLLGELFQTPPDERHATDYDDLVQHEAMVVTVEVDSREAARNVADLLTEAGAKRISILPQPELEDR